MSAVYGRAWRDGRLEREDFPLAELSDLLADPGLLVWLHLDRPEPEKLERLAEELSLDPHAVEDALAPDERAKATRHGTHTFITCYLTRLEVDESGTMQLRTPRISAFLLPQALITVGTAGVEVGPFIDRWEGDDLLRLGVGALLHGLLDTVVDGHFEAIQELDDAAEDLEDLLFAESVPHDSRRNRRIQQRIYGVRKALVQLRRKVLPMREVVSAVMRARTADEHSHRELDGYFDDLYDHVIRAAEWSESLREVVGNAFETNLSLQDARLNDIMKKLAGWGAIIAIPTAVTSWYGQNVPYPGFGAGWGVAVSAALIIVCAFGLYVLFRRVDWL